MKKIIYIVSYIICSANAQFDLYPVNDFFGGGIGYSPMYIQMDKIPAVEKLRNLGLNTDNFDNPFVIHGGEGFAHMTGKWRIGGYAGVGSSDISTVPNSYIRTTEEGVVTDSEYTGPNAPSLQAKITIALGAGSAEYVMPIFQDFEISAGALMGLGRINVSVDQRTGTAVWDNTYSSAYGTIEVDTLESGLVDYKWIFTEAEDGGIITTDKLPGVLNDVSGTFFNFQPYVAVKWQFLDRVGLRISVGFNKGTIGQGNWKLNGRTQVADSPEYTLQGVSFRTMVYLGL